MRVIVAGAIRWANVAPIRSALELLPVETTIIHGDCDGADALAGIVGRELGFHVEAWAKNDDDYRKYQRGAWKGLNERMLASGAERIFIFHPDFLNSKGSLHLAKLAEQQGIPVTIVAE